MLYSVTSNFQMVAFYTYQCYAIFHHDSERAGLVVTFHTRLLVALTSNNNRDDYHD
jgi:hypothetical protein